MSAAPEAEPEMSKPTEFRDMLSFPFVSRGGVSGNAEPHMPGQSPPSFIVRRKGIILCKRIEGVHPGFSEARPGVLVSV